MAGIQLYQPSGVGILNSAGSQHPAPVTVDVGLLCYLSFVGGTTTTYTWSLTRPAGSTAVISSATSGVPSFTPDVDGGAYSIQLIDTNLTVYTLDIQLATPAELPANATDEYTPIGFGARVNDASQGAANYTAFQACIAAAIANNRSIRVPQGDFTITSSTSLGLDMTTTGTQVLRMHGDGIYRTRLLISRTASATVDDCMYTNTCSGLILEDMSIVATRSARILNVSGGGGTRGPVRFSRLEVTGATRSAVAGGSTAAVRMLAVDDWVVEDCDIHGNGYYNGDNGSGGAPTGDAQIDGYGNGHDFLFDAGSNYRGKFLRNKIVCGHTHYAALIYDCYQCQAIGNKIYGNNPAGVRAKNRLLPVHTPGVQNDFSGYGLALYTHNTDVKDCIVTDNYIEETAGSGIYLQAVTGSVCSNNVLKNVARYQLDNQLPVGAICSTTGPCVFIGNKIQGAGGDTGIADGLPQGNPPPVCGYDLQGHGNVVLGGSIDSATKAGVRINGAWQNVRAGGEMVITNCGAGIVSLTLNTVAEMVIDGVTIDTVTGAGIQLGAALRCKIANAMIKNPGAQGVAVGTDGSGSSHIEVHNVTIKNATVDYAIEVLATDSKIEHCKTPGSTRGLLLGVGGNQADRSSYRFNDFSSCTIVDTSVSAASLATVVSDGNRMPLGLQGIAPARGGIIYARTVATTNITQSGTQTVAGIALADGDVCLCIGQGTANQNGAFYCKSSTWKRVLEADSGEKLRPGMKVVVGEGTYAGSVWRLTTAPPYAIDSTSLTWEADEYILVPNQAVSTSLTGLTVSNPTAAAAGAQQWSPLAVLEAQGWKTNATAASQAVDFALQARSVQAAANPTGELHLLYQVNGGGYSSLGKWNSVGDFFNGAIGGTYASQGKFRTANTWSLYSLKADGVTDFRVILSHSDDYVYMPGTRSKNDDTDFVWTATKARFDSGAATPELGQMDVTTNSATGQALDFHAQNATGTTSIGGEMKIRGGTGTSTGGATSIRTAAGTIRIKVDDTGIGFFNGATAAKPTVTGSRGANAALASLLTALAGLGLLVDSSS